MIPAQAVEAAAKTTRARLDSAHRTIKLLEATE